MKNLFTGKYGQLGWKLNRSLLPLGEVIVLGYKETDFSKPDRLRTLVHEIKSDIIVNAAAYTDVNKAESEEIFVTQINATALGILAEEAKRIAALLIRFSIDSVLDGTKETPYVEDDVPNPIYTYGRSKHAGEQTIQSVSADYLILQSSWVYAAQGHNFLHPILRLSREQENISVVGDQIGSPTWASGIVDTAVQSSKQSLEKIDRSIFSSGLSNLTSVGGTTWYVYANAFIDNARRLMIEELKLNDIEPISTIEYQGPVIRPKNSWQSTEKLTRIFNVKMPSWKQTVGLCMEDVF